MLESYNSQDLWLQKNRNTTQTCLFKQKNSLSHKKVQGWLPSDLAGSRGSTVWSGPFFFILIGFLPSKDGQVKWSLLVASAANNWTSIYPGKNLSGPTGCLLGDLPHTVETIELGRDSQECPPMKPSELSSHSGTASASQRHSKPGCKQC